MAKPDDLKNPQEIKTKKFSMPEISSSGNSINATTSKIVEELKNGTGLTTQSARKLIFHHEDQDHDGKKTRKSLRKAQASLRLQGFKTIRMTAGVQKIYFAYQTEEEKAELDKLASSKGLNIMEVK